MNNAQPRHSPGPSPLRHKPKRNSKPKRKPPLSTVPDEQLRLNLELQSELRVCGHDGGGDDGSRALHIDGVTHLSGLQEGHALSW